MAVQFVTPEEAVALIPDEATLAANGFVSCAHTKALTFVLEQRFWPRAGPAI